MLTIEHWKNWWKVKNADGFTIAKFLTENEAKIFSGTTSQLPCADLKLGNKSVHQRRGQVVKRIKIYP